VRLRAGDGGPHEVVTEEGRAVGQLPGAEDGRRGRVRHGLIALGELDDDGRRIDLVERLLPQMRRVRDRVARLRDPFARFEGLLDGHRARDGVDDRRLIAQRNVLVEAPRRWRERAGIAERWNPGEEREADQRTKRRAQPRDLDDRSPRDVRDTGSNGVLESQELYAVDAAERLAGVVDALAADAWD